MFKFSITDSGGHEAAETVVKNIKFFCSTPKGSLPQMRDYGLDYSIIDENFKTFRMKATVDIIRGLRDKLGITVKSINITADDDGVRVLNLEI